MNENASSNARRHILFSLKIAAVMVGGALLLTLARNQGWIDGELVVRGYNVIMGLALATYGNFMPKMMDGPPPRSIHDATLKQAVGRVSSWAMTLSFLTWAALWAFAPQDLALIGSLAAVGACAAVIAVYTLWKYVAFHTTKGD